MKYDVSVFGDGMNGGCLDLTDEEAAGVRKLFDMLGAKAGSDPYVITGRITLNSNGSPPQENSKRRSLNRHAKPKTAMQIALERAGL